MKSRMACVFVLICAAGIVAPAQTFTTLVDFNLSNGGGPFPPLTQGLDGNFYGTTSYGGTCSYPEGCGTVFKVSPDGTFTSLYNFCTQPNCPDGNNVESGLLLGVDGNFYGTTVEGGANNSGVLYRITPGGSFTVLYNFCSQANCTDGGYPTTTPIQGADGNFYGATQGGGNGGNDPGYGTLFKMTPGGQLTTIYRFCAQSGCADGEYPIASLFQGGDGAFYGTALGGLYDAGTIYKISDSGVFSSLYSFCQEGSYYCPDGAGPGDGTLALGKGGALYGTTIDGGASGNGTAYRITTSGSLTTLASFCQKIEDCPSGANPLWGLVEASDGNLYGTSTEGGTNDQRGGAAFELELPSRLNPLYSFCSEPECADGEFPGALVQGTDGNLYGVTGIGGTGGYGTVYKITLGLPPFIETVPTTSKVRARVFILGNNLTGATAVNFNGTAAPFSVVSDTEITATVPSGATSGSVTVTTPSGVLTSNLPFSVMP
jgi:uncharacterized repeat protein (TIGR03803 family)